MACSFIFFKLQQTIPCSLQQNRVRNVEKSFCICWVSKRQLFSNCPSDSRVSIVCPPCPTTISDTTALAYITSWKVLVRFQDKPVNSEAQTFTFFPTCLWVSAVCLGPIPWKAFTDGEKERAMQRAFQTGGKKTPKPTTTTTKRQQQKNQPQKTPHAKRGGEPHKDHKEKINF